MYSAPMIGFAVGGVTWVGFATYAYIKYASYWISKFQYAKSVYENAKDIIS